MSDESKWRREWAIIVASCRDPRVGSINVGTIKRRHAILKADELLRAQEAKCLWAEDEDGN
jgi:hypothetical protein